MNGTSIEPEAQFEEEKNSIWNTYNFVRTFFYISSEILKLSCFNNIVLTSKNIFFLYIVQPFSNHFLL